MDSLTWLFITVFLLGVLVGIIKGSLLTWGLFLRRPFLKKI